MVINRRGLRSWSVWALAVAVIVTLVAGIGVVYLHSGAHAVSVDVAVRRFRVAAATTTPTTHPRPAAPAPPTTLAPADASSGGLRAAASPAAPAPRAAPGASEHRPPEGVYVYATVGHEQTDALGGDRHDYPPQTTVTVRRDGCGWSEHWQPLEERWDETRQCLDPRGVLLRSLSTHHEFFHKTQQQDNDCGPNAVFAPTAATPGEKNHITCAGTYGTVTIDATVEGHEPIAVNGQQIDTLHIHYDLSFTGSNRGTGAFDAWTDARHVLTKRDWHVDIQTDSPFGTVTYQEQYTITLVNSTPQT